jgi:hypothetical protein
MLPVRIQNPPIISNFKNFIPNFSPIPATFFIAFCQSIFSMTFAMNLIIPKRILKSRVQEVFSLISANYQTLIFFRVFLPNFQNLIAITLLINL